MSAALWQLLTTLKVDEAMTSQKLRIELEAVQLTSKSQKANDDQHYEKLKELDSYCDKLLDELEASKRSLTNVQSKYEDLDICHSLEVQRSKMLEERLEDNEVERNDLALALKECVDEAVATIITLRSEVRELIGERHSITLRLTTAERSVSIITYERDSLQRQKKVSDEVEDSVFELLEMLMTTSTRSLEPSDCPSPSAVCDTAVGDQQQNRQHDLAAYVEAHTVPVFAEVHAEVSQRVECLERENLDLSSVQEQTVVFAEDLLNMLFGVLTAVRRLEAARKQLDVDFTEKEKHLRDALHLNSTLTLERSDYRREVSLLQDEVEGLKSQLRRATMQSHLRQLEMLNKEVDTNDLFGDEAGNTTAFRTERDREALAELETTVKNTEEQLKRQTEGLTVVRREHMALCAVKLSLEKLVSAQETDLKASESKLVEAEASYASLQRLNETQSEAIAKLTVEVSVNRAKFDSVTEVKCALEAEADRMRYLVDPTPENLDRRDRAFLAKDIEFLQGEVKRWRQEAHKAWQYVNRLRGGGGNSTSINADSMPTHRGTTEESVNHASHQNNRQTSDDRRQNHTHTSSILAATTAHTNSTRAATTEHSNSTEGYTAKTNNAEMGAAVSSEHGSVHDRDVLDASISTAAESGATDKFRTAIMSGDVLHENYCATAASGTIRDHSTDAEDSTTTIHAHIQSGTESGGATTTVAAPCDNDQGVSSGTPESLDGAQPVVEPVGSNLLEGCTTDADSCTTAVLHSSRAPEAFGRAAVTASSGAAVSHDSSTTTAKDNSSKSTIISSDASRSNEISMSGDSSSMTVSTMSSSSEQADALGRAEPTAGRSTNGGHGGIQKRGGLPRPNRSSKEQQCRQM
eukprot:Lankesteria_metandrocarpae@DN11_c0_g1_i2.p1